MLNREPLPLDTVSRLLTFLEKLTREMAGAGPVDPHGRLEKGLQAKINPGAFLVSDRIERL